MIESYIDLDGFRRIRTLHVWQLAAMNTLMRMFRIKTNPTRLPGNLPCQPVHQRPLQVRRIQLLRLHPDWDISKTMWLVADQVLQPCTIWNGHAGNGFARSKLTCGSREQTLWAHSGGDRNYSICSDSAAEDFALLTTRTVSSRYAAVSQFTVANVGLVSSLSQV